MRYCLVAIIIVLFTIPTAFGQARDQFNRPCIDAQIQTDQHNQALVQQDCDVNISRTVQAGQTNDAMVIQQGSDNDAAVRQYEVNIPGNR